MAGTATSEHAQQYAGYIRHKRVFIAVLVVLVIAVALISLCVGSSNLTIPQILGGAVGLGDPFAVTVVWNVRMPRILTAIVGGISLAVAGCAYQSVLRNPLASASTLGISQGAAFGAAIAIIVLAGFGAGGSVTFHEGSGFSNPYVTVICAFIGASASTVIILALSRVRILTPEAIVLAGVALAALFTGATAMIQYFAEDTQVAAVVFWTFGSLGRVSYHELVIMVIVMVAACIIFHRQRWNFNAMESGEVSAHSLGLNVHSVRLGNMAVATAAAASVIAFCGTINFIGLVAPHIMRRFLGNDYRFLLPASALCGALILLLADLIARVAVIGAILPISAITSFIGAPVFIYLLLRSSRRRGGAR